MPSKTNEKTLEAAIEKALTGNCLEDIKVAGNTVQEAQALYRSGNDYYIGDANDFNAKYALDETRFWHFLESTQKEELEKLQRSADWKFLNAMTVWSKNTVSCVCCAKVWR